MQKLNTQLAEQKKITEDYRGQLLAMESEMSALKDLATANKEVLKTRTKSMVDQVDLLKDIIDLFRYVFTTYRPDTPSKC